MSSAADMLEVGCPDPAPVLERMLSTRSCCASACHCPVPTVSPLICCVTTYLLGAAVRTDRIVSFLPRACDPETLVRAAAVPERTGRMWGTSGGYFQEVGTCPRESGPRRRWARRSASLTGGS